MKINYKLKNVAENSKAKKIESKAVKQQLYRFGQEISNWKLALEQYEDVHNSQTEELIRVYKDAILDNHLSAAIDVRKNRAISNPFHVINEQGEEIKEETKIFQSEWFFEIMKLFIDSRFWGFSLIQLGDRVGKEFTSVKSVDRQNVDPFRKVFKKFPQASDGIKWEEDAKYNKWLLFAGGPELGLLAKAVPMVFLKKGAASSWAEFVELFGSPMRIGKTNVKDDELRSNMLSMLENMGQNAYGVFNIDDAIEFVSDKKTDAYDVFNVLIERMNTEISKLILGTTMLLDEGGSRSQSEVHERITESIERGDTMALAFWVNKVLIPHLNKYHGFNISGKWQFYSNENLSKEEKFKIDGEILKLDKYHIPAEYLRNTYQIDIEEKEQEETPEAPSNLLNELDSKKKALSLRSEHFCNHCLSNEEGGSPIDWDEVTISEIIEGVYIGIYTVDNLPESVYNRIASELLKGIDKGIATVGEEAREISEDFLRSLKNNAYVFSGAKTFQQVREMSDFISDNVGRRVNFSEYEAKAREVFDTYNRNWLRTEIAQAENSAEMAAKWQKIEAEKDIFPFLRYSTVGDERVRPEHRILNGVIKRVDDPFWNTYYPPNGWLCRCTVFKEDDDATETPTPRDIDETAIPDSMKVNVGKQKLLFSPEHPYFIVEEQFRELKENNFNLPIPKDAQK